MLHAQPVEQDDLVQPVEELGAEMGADHLHHRLLDVGDLLVVAQPGDILAAEVRRQDDQRVGEVDGPSLPIGQPPVVEHLEQHVEHVGVRLLDLVEQDDLVRPAADRLGQDAAFVIADIARRGADQAADRVLLHELAHVEADHRARIVEQEARECLGQLGLADAGRTQEQERAERPVGVLQARPRPADGGRHRRDRRVLPDHRVAQRILHAEQFFALAFHHPVDRDAGPARHDPGDIVGRDLFLEHRAGARCLGLGQLAFEVGHGAVGQLAGAGIVAAALRLLDLEPRGVQLFLDPRRPGKLLLLRLPPRGQRRRLLLETR